MKSLPFTWVVTFGACVAIGACSGARPSDLFDPFDAGASVDATAVTPVPDSGGAAPLLDAGTQAPPPDSGAPAQTTPDAGSGAPDSGSAAGDAATSPDVTTTTSASVPCPNAGTCEVPPQVCCHQPNNGTGGNACTPPAQCTAVAIPCHTASDCAAEGYAGDVCCATLRGNDNQVAAVACATAATCAMAQGRQLCDRSDPSACSNGAACTANLANLPGFDICQ